MDARPFLKDIQVPTLILAPANSATTKLEEQQKLLQQIPDARMEVVHGEGHEIYVEQPEECQTAFLTFLSDLKRQKMGRG